MKLLQNGKGGVPTSVINEDQLIGNAVAIQGGLQAAVKLFERGALVIDRDHHAQFHFLSLVVRHWGSLTRS
jgi:hypothetical protein